ncbi:hypothetical protein DY000_02031255 [Brassica cretica]|uniref:Uncharacterized protein n=1 Tax=Brassica cretica TaxID=69181 RepID=A0ABQ7DH59_BRACR|nr:hypothetical protein DY000_02031255 [Brassica cretica]
MASSHVSSLSLSPHCYDLIALEISLIPHRHSLIARYLSLSSSPILHRPLLIVHSLLSLKVCRFRYNAIESSWALHRFWLSHAWTD